VREKGGNGVEVEPALEEVGNVLVPPKVSIPPGPPPEELVVRELAHVGGVAPRSGDLVGVQYVGLDYDSGKTFVQRWGPKNLYRYRWGSKEIPKSWQVGFTDVEVGDRRELLVPASLSEGKGPQLYVIEIVEVEWPRSSSAQ
jgi:peptidylprolyl isomerase